MLHRMSSVEALQKLNADWEKKRRRERDVGAGFKIFTPDGEELELSDVELRMLEDEGILARIGSRIKLAPGKTIEDVCDFLNICWKML